MKRAAACASGLGSGRTIPARGPSIGLVFLLRFGRLIGLVFLLRFDHLVGLVFLLGFGRLVGRFFLVCLGFSRAVFEIGHVPAATLQLKAGGTHELLECGFAAFGTFREQRVAHTLKIFVLKTARRTAVLVDRHDRTR